MIAMKQTTKALPTLILCLLIVLFTTYQATAQTKAKEGKACQPKAETAGCKPSSCRGAQTKFGEAKVITQVRQSLITLKAAMEQHTAPAFAESTYSMHNIVGDTDDESLAIIAQHVALIEQEFSTTLNQHFKPFSLPDNKAKQVQYLAARITVLQDLL